jgi:class 3 adenylate cyclase/pimeloyl-ACP methyl ester carboxylesterase
MNEPQIRYARTSDGVNIAYATAGSGYALLLLTLPGLRGNVQSTRRLQLAGALSRSFKTVWLDARGSGLSDREPLGFSLEALQRDIDAVSGAACGDRFALAGFGDMTPAAIAYAASHVESVSHLMLFDAWTETGDYSGMPGAEFERATRGQDWRLFTETLMHLMTRLPDEVAAPLAADMRAAVTPAAWRLFQQTAWTWNVTDLLDGLRAEVLVAQNRKLTWLRDQTGPRIAASIPGARFLLIDDLLLQNIAPIVEHFVLGAPPASADAESGMSAIVFLDIADSTALTERLGDARFREASRALDEGLRAAIREAGGTPVEGKVLGDGVMAVFTSAREAIDAALRCNALSAESELRLHIGIHAGDVIREPNNVYGGAVNIASRICDMSTPGEVLVSDVVRGMARSSAGVAFVDRGEHEMKGVAERVRVYAVRKDGG